MPFERNPDDLGALWRKTGSKGEYLTGEINDIKVVCFPNRSDNPKAPAWRVLRSKPKPQADAAYQDGEDVPF